MRFVYIFAGPFKVNGVPLRRVNQSYVIATSTKVDVAGVNVNKFDDKYFAKEAQKKKKKDDGEFFQEDKEVCLTLQVTLNKSIYTSCIFSCPNYCISSHVGKEPAPGREERGPKVRGCSIAEGHRVSSRFEDLPWCQILFEVRHETT